MDGKLIDTIKGQILDMIRSKAKFNKTVINNRLYYRPMQTNNRGASDSLFQMSKGTAIDVPTDKHILRFFTFWKGRGVDLDMSAWMFDGKNFDKIGWDKKYGREDAVYSGDNQGISEKNAEYIDIDMNKTDAQWVIVETRRWNNKHRPFGDFKTMVGFQMLDESLAPSEHWLPSAIANSANIETSAISCYMAALHVPTRKVIILDVSTTSGNVSTESEVTQFMDYLVKFTPNEEISWDYLNQGHILHLLSKNVVEVDDNDAILFDENTTWDKVASLI
jgi:hypothetical protein